MWIHPDLVMQTKKCHIDSDILMNYRCCGVKKFYIYFSHSKVIPEGIARETKQNGRQN